MTGTRGKILLVDDNERLRADFMLWFQEYDITEASSAAEALDLLAKPNDIDLVIMDVQMPGIDGLTALEKIKASAPEKSVIIMTGFSTKAVVLRALTAKADNYIEKPFELKTMRAAIEKELLTRSGAGRPDEMNTAGKIAQVKRFLENNRFKKLTLQDAARAVFMSPKYLSRVFREKTGIGFNDYKLKVKMEQAKEMLRATGSSVKQISAKLGYANVESFIRQFEKTEKRTPSCYRNRCKERR